MSSILSKFNPFGIRGPSPDEKLRNDVLAKSAKLNQVDPGIQKLINAQKLLDGPTNPINPGINKPVTRITVNPPNPPVTTPANPLYNPPIAKTPTSVFQLLTVGNALTKASKAGFLVIGYVLYKFLHQQKILPNINIEIEATNKQKIYEIGIGDTELCLAIEVIAGKNLRFLHDKEAANRIDSFVQPIFHSSSETDCNITINDPGNPLLRKGPISKYYPLSDKEGFNIIHRDLTLKTDPLKELSAYDHVDTVLSGKYSQYPVISIKVTDPISSAKEHRTQIYPLPFDPNQKRANAQYLRITQYQ